MISIEPSYYFDDGRHATFSKYILYSIGVIQTKSNNTFRTTKYDKEGYRACSLVADDGESYGVQVARMVVSSFFGKPPTLKHTADHMNGVRSDDHLENLRWYSKAEQSLNRTYPADYKSAFTITRGDVEKTAKEWAVFLGVPISTIQYRARHNTGGFSYKKYDDKEGEIWKSVGHQNSKGRWEVSNKCRLKFITTHGENVIETDTLQIKNGYPIMTMNKKIRYVHHVVFEAFFPSLFSTLKNLDLIRHKNDNALDFRPENLNLGSHTDNLHDAYRNNKRTNVQYFTRKCASYINGIHEKDHDSQDDAVSYLKSLNFSKASSGSISDALKAFDNNVIVRRYGRTWRRL